MQENSEFLIRDYHLIWAAAITLPDLYVLVYYYNKYGNVVVASADAFREDSCQAK